ncbi:DUF21 domain-containing protein [Candidatus Falkowbacteria bacterium]|nr:DUF21 domain-containing protein [Candidatus Falkowbacteria bacterium]
MLSYLISLVLLIFFSGFFSGVETALMSLSSIKVKALLRQKRPGAQALFRIKSNPRRLIITILIGNNLVNIAAASLATVFFTEIFGSAGVGMATGVMTFFILIFGEIVPKTFATSNAEWISLLIARPIEILTQILLPLNKIFEIISKGILLTLGTREESKVSEEELKTIVSMGRDEGLLSKDIAEMMHNVLKFRDKKVTEIMTPKTRISMLDSKAVLRDVVDFIIKEPFSRFPAYKEDDDNIVGVLDVDDVLDHIKNKKLEVKVSSLMRPVKVVPESKEIDDLLTEFEGEEVPMAIVVDEYGEVSGLVTIEDILEEIVGDIFDKSQKESAFIKKLTPKILKVDAGVPIEELKRNLKTDFGRGNFNTLAGFIQHKLQRMPKKGEEIKLKDFVIKVENATKQQIKSVKIIKP